VDNTHSLGFTGTDKCGTSPLSLDGWLEFNRLKWGLQPFRLRLTQHSKVLPALDVVLYLDRNGRIRQPRLNPYLPFRFLSTPTQQCQRIQRQWLAVSGLLAEEFAGRGLSGMVSFPPEIIDVREFQWRGFLAEARYTFYLTLPYRVKDADSAVRKQVAKAQRLGYRCERTTHVDDICFCLKETERRQGFHHHLDEADLQLALKLMGEDSLRCYVCYAPNGEAASARVVLQHCEHAIDWVAGTVGDHLANGVTQFVISYMLEDLEESRISTFDYCGANIRSIAASKATWGGELMPYYRVTPHNMKRLARFMLDMRHYRRWFEW
jgi:hypothetical protein